MVSAYGLLLSNRSVPIHAEYRPIKRLVKESLTCVSAPDSRSAPTSHDLRLYINGKPTEYFEHEGSVSLKIDVFQNKNNPEAYLRSTRTSNGAILAWSQSYLYWNGNGLQLLKGLNCDSLAFHPDGRLLGIEQFDSFAGVGVSSMGWEQDREAYLVYKGKSTHLGQAVNLWFEKDGSIKGISNGRGVTGGPRDKPSPHYFSYRNGVRLDKAVSPILLKRRGKRLYTVNGISSQY